VSADPLKYATVSVRWAILLLLSEAAEPLGVPDIKTALEAGGIRSRAEDFKNNVSSVLSVMKSARQEVDVVDGKWQITETGRSAIDYIKATKLKKIYPRRATADASTSAVLQPKGGDGL
jgi:hypothetical protein